MSNPQRGEVTIQGPEGKVYTMCLTLGAIAELEERLGESLTNVDEVMKKGRMKDLLSIFFCLLHGVGHCEFKEPSDLMSWQIKPRVLATKIAEAFKAAGFSDEEDEEPGKQSPGA